MATTATGGGAKQTASAQVLTENVLSSIDMKPQHLLQLFKMNQSGLESRAFIYSHMLGFSKEVAGTTYYHTEKDLSNASLSYTAITTTGQVSVYELAGDSATYFYARVNDIIKDKNGLQGFVTAVDSTAGTVTVQYPAGITAPTTTTDDGIVIISARSHGEGSSVGDAALSRASRYENRTQIIKEKVSQTSTAGTNETWVNYGPKGYYSMQLWDGETRMYRHLENMFMHGEVVASGAEIADPNSASGAKMYTTDGLLSVAAKNGTTLSGIPTSLADFDTIGNNNLANFVKTTTPIWTNAGATALNTIDTIFYGTSSELQNNQSFLKNATDSSLFKASEAYGAYANFKYLNKRYTYMFETNEAWSDPTGYGAEGFGYQSKGVMVPINKVKDGMSGKKFGTMGTRYKNKYGLNRKFMMGDLNGFGSVNGKFVNEVDLQSTMWLSDTGAQFMGSHQYTIWQNK